MQKKVKTKTIKAIAFSEISLMILASFAVAVILAESGAVIADNKINWGDFGFIEGGKQFANINGEKVAVQGFNYETQTITFADGTTSAIGGLSNGYVRTISDEERDILLAATSTTGSTAASETPDQPVEKRDLKVPPSTYTGFLSGLIGITNKTTEAGSKEAMLGGVMDGLAYAAVAYGAGRMIGSMVGWEGMQTEALSEALAAGVFAYQFATSAGASGWLSFGIGAAVAALIFVLRYKKETTKTVTISCLPYEAPIGGAKCEECNKDPMRPCSEYRCRALGQACQLLNKETPGKEKCTWVNPKDVDSPTITPSPEYLYPSGLSYISDTSVRPPALGVKIVRGNIGEGCLQAFTPLQFGVSTNEPAQCKIDSNHTAKFEDMGYYLGDNYYSYNHTQKLKLPGPDAFGGNETETGSPIFKNDGTSQLFVRCRDANGNENVDEYSIKFCVDKSPDTTPPSIEGTSIPSGNPVRYNSDKVSVQFYINEPSECKWSITSGQPYENMANNMDCVTDPTAINALLSYTCFVNLTGIKNSAENSFYIRCKDKPGSPDNERNVMTQDYVYVLKGSQPLNIVSTGPNETVKGSTEQVTVDLTVETDDGAEEGKAYCHFSPLGANGTYVEMAETNDYKHKQTLQLVTGNYKYWFRCTDLGGNSAESTTSFSVLADREAPKVTRVYREEATGLKVVTNEDAECVYSLTSCNFKFDEGLKLLYSNPSIKTNSYLEWKPNTVYYIKCRDLYGNEPNPNVCSVVAKPLETTLVRA